MACEIQIDSVTGKRKSNGDLYTITVSGFARNCDAVGVTVTCGASHTLETKVDKSEKEEGNFHITFFQDDVVLAECQCEAEISVHVFCLEDPSCEKNWSGKLACEEYQPPDTQQVPEPTGHGEIEGECDNCPDGKDNIRDCKAPDTAPGPQYIIPFHQLLGFFHLKTPGGIEQLQDEKYQNIPIPSILAATFVNRDDLSVELGTLLQFDQRWFFQRLYVSDVVSSIALAPNETLTLRFKKTQRKRLTQRTIDSTEELNSSESTTIDKDVLNVTRASSKTEGWSVSGNASFSLGGIFRLGGGVNYNKTISDSANASSQQIREATRKSARTLKTLHKTEVEEVTETLVEDSAQRKIRNPYRNRSLLIKVFELEKHYCVENKFISIKPALIIHLKNLKFDRAFVLDNRQFLNDMLIDQYLAAELFQALDNVVDNNFAQSKERANQVACLALAYLFEIKDIFDLPSFTDTSGSIQPIYPKNLVNDPKSSFEHDPPIGFNASLQSGFGVLFTTLGMYYDIYKDRIAAKRTSGQAGDPINLKGRDEFLPIDIALSLEKAITPLWEGKEAADLAKINSVLNNDSLTEVYRRLSGFQSLVKGMLRPLIQPLEEDKERWEAGQRAELVIGRVMAHLKAHGSYYTKTYLRYLVEETPLDPVHSFAEDIINGWLINPNQQALAQELFDPNEAFIDGQTIVVPAKVALDNAKIAQFEPTGTFDNKNLDDDSLGVDKIFVYPEPIEVPFDGVHLEAIPGDCPPLPDIVNDDTGEAEVTVKAQSW